MVLQSQKTRLYAKTVVHITFLHNFFFSFHFLQRQHQYLSICSLMVLHDKHLYTHYVHRQTNKKKRQKDRRNEKEYGAYSSPQHIARVSFAFGQKEEKSSARHCGLSNVLFNLWWRWRVDRLTSQVENMIGSTISTDRINRIYMRGVHLCARWPCFSCPQNTTKKKYEIQSTHKSNSIQCTLHSRMQFILLLILRLRNTLWPMCVSVYVCGGLWSFEFIIVCIVLRLRLRPVPVCVLHDFSTQNFKNDNHLMRLIFNSAQLFFFGLFAFSFMALAVFVVDLMWIWLDACLWRHFSNSFWF